MYAMVDKSKKEKNAEVELPTYQVKYMYTVCTCTVCVKKKKNEKISQSTRVQLLNGKQSVQISCATETDGYATLVALRTNGMNWSGNGNVFLTATVYCSVFTIISRILPLSNTSLLSLVICML